MPQVNTISTAALLSSTDVGNVTSETQYKDSGGTNKLLLPIPASNKLKAKPWYVLVGGRAGSGTTSNFTAAVYFGNHATISNNTAIATTGAIALASANHNWFLEILCMWDVTSKKIQGNFTGQVANSLVSLAALTNPVTSVDLSLADTDYSATAAGANKLLTVTALFGSSNASNTSIVDYFEIQNY